ncbi:AraC family transcriptional regulator [Paenibacillus albicereus]|uniref:AraC family transcriptional regulator n=1 Tax=Paenibacillus albicereus TaxID=2726185 RepID=A0A6H2H0S5_9BACL|nr:AraC family transcriptional regulator [Paenibacillus albicereus]QJC53291.1 AraC family transcriptional regulator [Paenibacillus albicereus]
MDRYRESAARLNGRIVEAQAGGERFVIHYWGADGRLPSNPVHKHSFFEACYVLGGTGTYRDGDAVHELYGGVLFLSRPGIEHQIVTEEGLAIVFVAFELDESGTEPEAAASWRELERSAQPVRTGASGTPSAQLWESLLIREDGRFPLPESALAPAASALLASFRTLFGEKHARTVPSSPRPSQLLRRAKLYIRDNLSGPLSLGDVASALHVSERQLSRLFSGGIHESFSGHVRRERIREAARLLARDELPIKEIAERTGFSSVHYFTRTFRAVKGTPPGEFRKRAGLNSAD